MPAPLDKRPAAPEHDRRGEDELNPREQTRRELNAARVGPAACRTSPAINSGRESAALIQKRRVMSTNSGLGASSRVAVLGSSAMPQIGQDPGSSRTISGCIGQTYSIRVAGAAIVSGSSAMPHFGQAPGLDARTSGSIGQTYTGSARFRCRRSLRSRAVRDRYRGQHGRRAFRLSHFSGSSLNFCAQ